MATFLAKAHLQGVPATMTFYDTAGASLGAAYVNPNWKRLALTHGADYRKVMDSSGNIQSATVNNEFVEVQFEYILEGTSQANAKLSGALLPVGGTATTSGLPVIVIGTFTDGLNAGTTSNPWIYEGGASEDFFDEDHATGRITLRRYKPIVNQSAFLATA